MPTTATGNYVCDNSSLANFKSWAMAISAAFSAFGWTQAGDSGQVNWSSIASVPSSTYVYEIWNAADSEAGTLPISVKVEYGFTGTSVQIRMTVGTGSSGAGAITGAVCTGTPWEITSLHTNQGATTFPCYFSGDAGEFRMYMWQSGSVNTGVVFAIERSKDATGAKTTDYVTACSANTNNASGNQQTIISTSLVAIRDTGIFAPALSSNAATGNWNGTIAAFPVLPVYGKVGNPMLGLLTVVAADVADGATVTVASMYGGTHTYVAASRGGISGCVGSRTTNNLAMGLLVRYE